MLQVDLPEFTERLHEIELKKPEWIPKIRPVAVATLGAAVAALDKGKEDRIDVGTEELQANVYVEYLDLEQLQAVDLDPPTPEEHEYDKLNVTHFEHFSGTTESDAELTFAPPTTPEENELDTEWTSGVPPLPVERFSDAIASQVPCLIICKHWMRSCHCQVRDIANAVYFRRATDESDQESTTLYEDLVSWGRKDEANTTNLSREICQGDWWYSLCNKATPIPNNCGLHCTGVTL